MAHETDDHGFPLNPSCCPTCAAISKQMNDALVNSLFTYKPLRDQKAFDYDGNSAREYKDNLNDNRRK